MAALMTNTKKRTLRESAYIAGFGLAATLLMACSPDAASAIDLTYFVDPIGYAMKTAIQAVPTELTPHFLDGMADLARSVSEHLSTTILVPARHTIEGTYQSALHWAQEQKDLAFDMGSGAKDVIKGVAHHLAPKSAGDFVEKAVVAVVGLKSFVEGIELLKKGWRTCFGKKKVADSVVQIASPAVTAPEPAKVEEKVVTVHVFHHKGTVFNDDILVGEQTQKLISNIVAPANLDELREEAALGPQGTIEIDGVEYAEIITVNTGPQLTVAVNDNNAP